MAFLHNRPNILYLKSVDLYDINLGPSSFKRFTNHIQISILCPCFRKIVKLSSIVDISIASHANAAGRQYFDSFFFFLQHQHSCFRQLESQLAPKINFTPFHISYLCPLLFFCSPIDCNSMFIDTISLTYIKTKAQNDTYPSNQCFCVHYHVDHLERAGCRVHAVV